MRKTHPRCALGEEIFEPWSGSAMVWRRLEKGSGVFEEDDEILPGDEGGEMRGDDGGEMIDDIYEAWHCKRALHDGGRSSADRTALLRFFLLVQHSMPTRLLLQHIPTTFRSHTV